MGEAGKKRLALIMCLCCLITTSQIALAAYKSKTTMESSQVYIAKFVANANGTDYSQKLKAEDGIQTVYAGQFTVQNTSQIGVSEVSQACKIEISTQVKVPEGYTFLIQEYQDAQTVIEPISVEERQRFLFQQNSLQSFKAGIQEEKTYYIFIRQTESAVDKSNMLAYTDISLNVTVTMEQID